MKNLLSVLGVAGIMALSGIAHGGEYPKINVKDVPVPKAGQEFAVTPYNGVAVFEYKIDGMDVMFFFRKVVSEFRSEELTSHIYGRALYVFIDLNRNGNIEDNERFAIDYGDVDSKNSEIPAVPETPSYCPIPEGTFEKKVEV